MKKVLSVRGVRTRLVFLALVAGTGGSMLAPASTHAAATSCRSDPVIKLSNGKKLTVTTTIFTAQSNVSHVSYTVSIPSNVGMTGITYTAGWGSKEVVKVTSTNSANTYTTTYLASSTSSVSTTGNSSLSSSLNKTLASKSYTALTNQSFSLTVTG